MSPMTRPNFTEFSVRFSVADGSVSSDDSAVRYVLPVLWMKSCFPITGPVCQNQARRCFVQFARWRYRGEVCRLRLHLILIGNNGPDWLLTTSAQNQINWQRGYPLCQKCLIGFMKISQVIHCVCPFKLISLCAFSNMVVACPRPPVPCWSGYVPNTNRRAHTGHRSSMYCLHSIDVTEELGICFVNHRSAIHYSG